MKFKKNTSCFEIMQICDILIECLHNRRDRFAFSHVVIFNVKYYQQLKNIHLY